MLRIGIDTHAITSHFVLPLLIRRAGGLVVEMTDGTAEATWRQATAQVPHFCISESPTYSGRAVAALAADPQAARWSACDDGYR